MQKIFTILLFIFCFGDLWGQQLQQEAQAKQHLHKNEFEQAAVIYKTLYERYDKNRYYTGLLKSLTGTQDYSSAEKLIKQQLQAQPGNAAYKIDLAELYAQQGLLKDAEKQYKNILNSLPNKPYLINSIVTQLYGKGKTKLAIEALLKGRKQLNDPSLFTFELARLYYLDKQLSKTLEELLDYLERNPKSFSAIKGQLRYYSRSKDDILLLRKIVEDRISASSKKPQYPKLMVWVLIQQNNYAEALEWAIKLNKIQPDGYQVLGLAQLCVDKGQYETAEKAYRHLLAHVKTKKLIENAKTGLLNALYQKVVSGHADRDEAEELAKELTGMISGKDAGSAEMTFNLAVLNAEYLGRVDKAIALLQTLLDGNSPADTFKAKCKLKLGDYYLLNNTVWESVLLYGQVAKAFENDSLGREARFRNARLSYFLGELDWAKRELDVLKGATSQLMANDALNLGLLIAENQGPDSGFDALKMYARADLLIFRNSEAQALRVLDSIETVFPGHSLSDDILMSKARIHIRMKEYVQALTLLNEIADRYAYDIWADDALFKMATLYENRLNDKTRAQSMYKKLLLDYPGSLYTLEARKRFRMLRGDSDVAPSNIENPLK